MPSDYPPMGVVNSPQITALQNVAVVKSQRSAAFLHVPAVNSHDALTTTKF
jgi:hypothetical protein